MYRDLVYRPGEDSYTTRDLVFRPGVDTTSVEVLPYLPNRTNSIQKVAEDFLESFLRGGDQTVAGYVPFKGVAPADVDIGGPESPETLARMAEYLRQRRERGDFERIRQNLIKQGFPLGGV
jgi:hypothetical protein